MSKTGQFTKKQDFECARTVKGRQFDSINLLKYSLLEGIIGCSNICFSAKII